MTTTTEQIDLWRQSPSEHQRLEFKEAKTQFDNHKLYEDSVAPDQRGWRTATSWHCERYASFFGLSLFRH